MQLSALDVHRVRQELSNSLSPNANEFFSLYYTFTGIHFLHVVVGVLTLLYMRALVRRDAPDPRHGQVIENGGIFWHLVDLLWIVLFALFYLVHS